jgi:hypothetical protein
LEVVKKSAYGLSSMSAQVLILMLSLSADPPPTPPPFVPEPFPTPAATTTAPAPVNPTTAGTGAVMTPAALPAGALAFAGVLGAPDVGALYRQGFSALELDAKAMFNYLELAFLAEGGVRLQVYDKDKLSLAPELAVGLKFDSGSHYFDRANFAFVGLRPRVAFHAVYRFTDTVSGIGSFDLPWSAALTVRGFQVSPTVGAGAEFHVGGRISVSAAARIGIDWTKEPLGVTQVRAAWGVVLGVGYRMF